METVTKQELDQMETELTASIEFSRKTDAKMTVQKLEKELAILRLAKKGLEK